MNDPAAPSRLAMLRFLARVQEQDLDRTRRWIADEEEREIERERGRQARPPAPDWLIEQGQARRALAEGVAACTHCRPDTDLGFTD